MGIYSDKLCEMVPTIKRVYMRIRNEIICSKIEIEKWSKDYYEVEYLKNVFEFLENSDGIVFAKRFFLVTEEETIGEKAAFAILNYPVCVDRNENMCRRDEENQRMGHMSKTRKREDALAYFSSKKEYAACLTGEAETDYVYFSGLEEENFDELEMKLQCIMSCHSLMQFVQIRKENLNKPWARELLKNRECEIIYLPKVESSYYFEIMERLLEGERHKMDSSLKTEQIVRNIRRKCGSRFGEEDIAWSLDRAEKNAIGRWDFRCLKAEDFKLDIYEHEPVMKKLDEMTGLDAVKLLAREYAALGREQLRNEKLTDVCKHVIFVGKPGTGKTMCGEILAQIMAEQGQSNGSFIVASRKDIVAEYVGQTAPKVAGLFAKSRKGVLFVDEAGFLLHDTKGSFNQEAIKEFVRYMEMYQDVTVIFALYPGEAEEFLKLDMGLCSRISRIVSFKDYSQQELMEIIKKMCEDRGYQMSEDAEGTIRLYLNYRKRSAGDEFGNAREGRKLVEAAIIARSMRCFDDDVKEKIPMLVPEDFEYGINRLKQEQIHQKKTWAIGFTAGGDQSEEVKRPRSSVVGE